ncbi:hypothetical protein V6N11_005026 [Hibiscus sabdariffa]|uniref:Endonuclease/exonuclease/phosphatase domain-containing protein n=1 Tax=Hibiscus sabdariffa TaxID=183260 RepID=A0ABR2NHT1_9ROSI
MANGEEISAKYHIVMFYFEVLWENVILIGCLGFSNSFRVEASGLSGEIWLLWNDAIDVDILKVSNQFVHGRACFFGSSRWVFFTAVYASPNVTIRKEVWNQLSNLNSGNDLAWLLGGDFNFILRSKEREGGPILGSDISHLFQDFIFDNGLLEAEFRGNEFTWKRGLTRKRLDHCLFNKSWANLFPNSLVTHLDRVGFDHCPLLLSYPRQDGDRESRPFRFLTAWHDHP